jgi:hypothetical protein
MLEVRYEKRKSKMQNRNWITWVVLGLVVLFVLSVISIPFSGMGHAGGWGMRQGMEADGSMHGFTRGGWGFGPFGLLFGVIGMLFRFGLLALLLFGGLLLWQRLSGSGNTASGIVNDLSSRISSMFTRATCPKCGHAVQSQWQHCPNCGHPLAPVDDKGSPPPTESVNV